MLVLPIPSAYPVGMAAVQEKPEAAPAVAQESDASQAARHAVRALDGDELRAFHEWYEEYYNEEGWDKQIEMDSLKGRLDHMREEAREALARGEVEPL